MEKSEGEMFLYKIGEFSEKSTYLCNFPKPYIGLEKKSVLQDRQVSLNYLHKPCIKNYKSDVANLFITLNWLGILFVK